MNKFHSDGHPRSLTWHYDRAELIADGVVHALGVAVAAVGAIILLVLALRSAERVVLIAVSIYAVSLLAALALSAAYNMWPVSPLKWWLRRFDHAAIYLLIGGTYTPFLALSDGGITAAVLLAAIWLTVAIGVVLKLLLPGRFDRLAVALYLLLGWSVSFAYGSVTAAIPTVALVLLLIGGLLYSAGVLFHVWHSLRFQNAIWHAFVLAGAACHYVAIVDFLPPLAG
jgi:hemolysin III